MRRFIQHNVNLFFRLDSVELRPITFESETEKNFKKVFKALDVGDSVKQGIFYSRANCKTIAARHSRENEV